MTMPYWEALKKTGDVRKILVWTIGLWLVCAVMYGLFVYIRSRSTHDYEKYYTTIEKALAKNGYNILKSKENQVQFKKKEWTGTYYVDLRLNKRRQSNNHNLVCKISFYPKDRKKRPDRWEFVWESLSENPKLVGVINYIAKTLTKNQISGVDIQEEIEKKRKEGKPKSVLILQSNNRKYHFRLKPLLSKVVCEFSVAQGSQ